MLSVQDVIKNYLKSQNVSKKEWEEIVNPTKDLQHTPYDILGSREWLNDLYNHKDDVITIVGDYDADGILSSATMRKGLEILGVGSKINTYVPTRMDGYGMTVESVIKLKAQFPDTETIITVDNGVSAFDGIQEAKNNGWHVLVTDHHLAKNEGLPVADQIVDINRPGDTYAFKGISGTAMAYKMIEGYAKILKPEMLPLIENLQTLVGLSTVTDMMPMRHENRYWVRYALNDVQESINGLKTSHTEPHLFNLIKVLKRKNKLFSKTADDSLFGFTLGPILNAPSRVTGTPQLAYDLFMAETDEEMESIAEQLIDMNEKRKAIVGDLSNNMINDIQEKMDNGEEIVANAVKVPLTSGFVGLIAGNIQSAFNTPTIAFSTISFDGEILDEAHSVLHGSARSPEGISIVKIMEKMLAINPDIILGYGGHAAAAGLTIENDKFDEFYTLFNKVTKELLSQTTTDTSADDDLEKNVGANAFIVNPEDISFGLIEQIERMMPFGEAFPRPSFILENIPVDRPLFIGANKQHIKFNANRYLSIVNWNAANSYVKMGKPSSVSVSGTLSLSEYQGRTSLQLTVDKWQ